MLEEMKIEKVLEYDHTCGTVVTLSGVMNNLAVLEELQRIADNCGVEVLATDEQFFYKRIAFASKDKVKIQYFIYNVKKYKENIEKLERVFLQGNPVFN